MYPMHEQIDYWNASAEDLGECAVGSGMYIAGCMQRGNNRTNGRATQDPMQAVPS